MIKDTTVWNLSITESVTSGSFNNVEIIKDKGLIALDFAHGKCPA